MNKKYRSLCNMCNTNNANSPTQIVRVHNNTESHVYAKYTYVW